MKPTGLPIRVLQVVVNMNRGGAETLIMNWYRHIDRSKVQFDFLTCKEGSFDKEIEALGGTIHRIPYVSEAGHFAYLRALDHFFKAHHYSAIHVHMDKMSGFVLRAAKRAQVPIRIAHSHSTGSEGNLMVKSYKWTAGQLIVPNASHLFACSKKASDWLYGSASKRAIVLKNGIDSGRFRRSTDIRNRVRAELNLPSIGLCIGHVGRFSEPKNHRLLIDIFEKVMRINPDARLILVGDGPLRPEIEEKVQDLGLQTFVRFLGTRYDVQEVMQAFDVMVFPSKQEGVPVALIEAQSLGIPCVISDAISDEVDIGAGLITYENILRSPLIWAEQLLFNRDVKDHMLRYIKDRGYDIEQSTAWLEWFYLTAHDIA